MNWRWTWLNFVVSVLINRLWFLIDRGVINFHVWALSGSESITIDRSQTVFTDVYFYLSVLLSVILLALFQRLTSRFGVLFPEMPEVVHASQDGQIEPLVDLPAQTLTRQVSVMLQLKRKKLV